MSRGWVIAADAYTFVAAGDGFDPTGSDDSSVALQALVDAAAASAAGPIFSMSTVVIPSGVRLKVGNIVPKSRVHIQGHGGGLVSNGHFQGIFSNRTAGVFVNRFWVTAVTMVGPGQDYSPEGSGGRYGGIAIYSGADIRIRDCTISGFASHGITLRNAQDVYVEDNTIFDCCGGGGLENAITVTAALAGPNPAPQPSTSRIEITGNTVRNCPTACICLQSSIFEAEFVESPSLEHDCVIANNPCLEAVTLSGVSFAAIAIEIGRDGILPSTGISIHKVTVHDNVIKTTGTPGAGSPVGIQITDNNGGAATNSTSETEFQYINVHDNVIDSVADGIVSNASDAKIHHNTIVTYGQGIQQSYNQNASHLPKRVTIDTNTITCLDVVSGGGTVFTAKAGIRAYVTNDLSVINNRIKYSGSSTAGPNGGIYISNCGDPEVNGNRVTSAPRYPIYLLSCDNPEVCHNRILDGGLETHNTYSGIFFDTCTNPQRTQVHGNNILERRSSGNRLKAGIGGTGGNPRLVITENNVWGVISGPLDFSGITPARVGPNSWTSSYPSAPTVLTVTTGAYTVTGTYYNKRIAVSGGTVSSITLTRNGVTVNLGQVAGTFLVEGQDVLTINNTVIPTVTEIPCGIA